MSIPHIENDGDYENVLPRLMDLRILEDVAESLDVDIRTRDVYDLLGSIASYLTTIGVSLKVEAVPVAEDDEGSECDLEAEMSIAKCAANLIASASCPKALEVAPSAADAPSLSAFIEDGRQDALELGLVAEEPAEVSMGMTSPKKSDLSVEHSLATAASPGPSPNKRYRCRDPDFVDPVTLKRNAKLCQAAQCGAARTACESSIVRAMHVV